MDEQPFVTVVLPVRNEARFIERCLAAVVGQNYPADRMEILVVDGMSRDGTREIVAAAAARDSRIRLLDNPSWIVPSALNRGIRAARGDIIVRVDGHTIIAPDYVRLCVAGLAATQADNAGGPMHANGGSWIGRAIALATSSPFGVGSARFHYARDPGWVDTVYLGAYPRHVFERIGLFDEELVRNQDDEFNLRLTRTGGKIWLDPDIRSEYFSRATLRSLWRQYFEYGFWKVRVIQKHRRPGSFRHLIPAIFAMALGLSAVASLLVDSPLPFLAVGSTYVVAAFAAAVFTAFQNGWRYTLILPVIFATLHLGYGFGFIAGLVQFGLFRRSRGGALGDEPVQ